MNHTTQYRTTLPHQIQTQCPPLQTFTARFPTLDSLNAAVMIPAITPDETGQYGQMAPFITDIKEEQQQQHLKEQHTQPPQQGNNSNECELNDSNCPTTSGQTSTDFCQTICRHGVKDCIQCYNKTPSQQGQASQTTTRNKIMVDASTMTDSDEMDVTTNWQNVSVPANTKVAEYLTSLRQFLKMDRRFVCGVCGLGHTRREQLERHQLSHSQERKHVCPACQKRFKRNEHLARHVITHSGLKPHGCLECGKAFYRKDHLRKHLLAHETKRIRLAAGLTTGSGGGVVTGGSGATANTTVLEGEGVSEVKSLSLSLP